MFRYDLEAYITEYVDSVPELAALERYPSKMLMDLCISKFKQKRNYPGHFTEEKIEADLYEHEAVIAMAVIDLFNKEGVEGAKTYSQNGISTTYENAFVSNSLFNDILPYVKAIW